MVTRALLKRIGRSSGGARRVTVVFILDARRIAKRRQGGKRDCGVAQGYEQFGSQRDERSIACARLTRSPTYDLDAREEEKRADDIRWRGAETVTPPRDRRAARHDATGDSKDAYFAANGATATAIKRQRIIVSLNHSPWSADRIAKFLHRGDADPTRGDGRHAADASTCDAP